MTHDPFVNAFVALLMITGPALILALAVLIGEPILLALDKRKSH